MKKMLSHPPLYFYLSIFYSFLTLWMTSDTLISFPYNFLGVIPLLFGYYLSSKASRLFMKKGTTFELEKPSEFVIEGLYEKTRNPMYLGGLILIIGLSVLMGNSYALLAPLFFFLAIDRICIKNEEKLMESTFGEQYLNYKKKVRRWV